jgi:hypothetical protein
MKEEFVVKLSGKYDMNAAIEVASKRMNDMILLNYHTYFQDNMDYSISILSARLVGNTSTTEDWFYTFKIVLGTKGDI